MGLGVSSCIFVSLGGWGLGEGMGGRQRGGSPLALWGGDGFYQAVWETVLLPLTVKM